MIKIVIAIILSLVFGVALGKDISPQFQDKLKNSMKDLSMGDRKERQKAAELLYKLPKKAKRSVFSLYEKGIKQLDESLPVKVDEYTVLSEAQYSKKGVYLFYDISIEKIKYDSSEYNSYVESIKNRLINGQCSLTESAMYMLYGKTINVYYNYTKDRSLMFKYQATWEDCAKRV